MGQVSYMLASISFQAMTGPKCCAFMPERVGLMGTHSTGEGVYLQTDTMCSVGYIHQGGMGR